MKFAFLHELCESHLIPSQTSLKHWKPRDLTDLCYLYFLGLRILLANSETSEWARSYCHKAGEPNNFVKWRTDGNDLYVMLHALSSDPDDEDNVKDTKFLDRLNISPIIIRHWLRDAPEQIDSAETHKLFMRLDSMFRIDNATMRALRRTIMEWDELDEDARHDVIVKLVQMIRSRAPSNSELLPQLKKLDRMDESATSGATGAASIATATGGLGAGFDPDGQWRSVYSKVIRRIPKKKKPAE